MYRSIGPAEIRQVAAIAHELVSKSDFVIVRAAARTIEHEAQFNVSLSSIRDLGTLIFTEAKTPEDRNLARHILFLIGIVPENPETLIEGTSFDGKWEDVKL